MEKINKIKKPAFSLYDASAGSGKTYTLVKEYLKIILLSNKIDAYRSILAITFTNKAVHEMKSRVLENLSEFTKDTPSKSALQLMQNINSETNLSLSDIQTKAKSIIKNIIHNYAAFDISTIDKFTYKVIRAFAHDLNLPITFEVSLDTENLLTEAVDAIIAQAGEDEIVTKLLVDFTLEKTDDDKSWDISREIMETGKLILNENNREEITHFNTKSIADFIIIKEKLIEIAKQLESETVQLATEAIQLIDKNGIDLKSFSYGTFPNHLNFIISKDIKANNHKFLVFEDVKIKKDAKDATAIKNIIPNLLEILALIYSKFEKKNFYHAFLKNITPLSLLNTLSNELSKIQKEQNILSIAEFNKLIYDQIQNQPAPFIYERLGEKFRHFFIDEFQDTSEMQWKNLIPLIDNALSSEDLNGERGSLMIVGDPKQSIYRWRGGKAEQFIALSKGENPFNNPDKEIFSLDTNYRSYSQIIDFNNDFFKFLSNEFENEDYKELYQNHSHQKDNDKIGGYITISFIPKIDKEEVFEEEDVDKTKLYLKATLQKIIEVKQNGFSNSDIVVLTRKKTHGSAIANHLTASGIPIVSSESLLIGNSSEVKCIIHLLRYLKNNNDTESKANFLYYLAVNKQEKLATHSFISRGIEIKNEIDFQNWLNEFGITFSFENSRKKSLYEATEIIIASLIPIEKRNAYVHYFLDIVLERDVRNQAGISDFLYYWDKNNEKFSIPSPEGNDAVRIMTIHKSKGLEFPVVIFPFAEEDFSKNLKDKIWLNAGEEIVGLPKLLVDKSNKVAGFGDEAATSYKQKTQEDLLDIVNVLYVAMTRAVEQLHVISSMNIKKDGSLPSNLSSFFIQFLANKSFEASVLEYKFGHSIKISPKEIIKNNNQIIPQLKEILNPKNIKIAQRESVMWDTKQQKAIEFGNLIHEILSFINTKNDIQNAISKAIENGLLISTQKQEVLKTINQIVNHKDLMEFFLESNKVLNEQAIIYKEGIVIKPDRIVISKQKKVFLLDYKTGLYLPKHKLQIENYEKVIFDLGFVVAKKTLVYIGNTIEVIHLHHKTN